MSDEINDKGAAKFHVGEIPISMASIFREITTTGQYTQDNKKNIGASLLYPFWDGKHKPDSTIAVPYSPAVTLKNHAQQISDGQSAIVIVNRLICGVKITRPYRDWGNMIGIPYDADGKANYIPGIKTTNKEDYFCVGAYINDNASIFAGSGGVLYVTPEDTTIPSMALGYGTSMSGGYGLCVMATAQISDVKKFYNDYAGGNSRKSGYSSRWDEKNLVGIASVANSMSMDNDHGGVFTFEIAYY